MKKGLVITGLAFLTGILLIASANYLILSREKREMGATYKMRIDAVANRHFDAQWIIHSAAEEALNGDCEDAADDAEDNIEDALESEEMSTGSVQFSLENVNTRVNYDEDDDPTSFTVEVEYEVNSETHSIRKHEEFEETYSCD